MNAFIAFNSQRNVDLKHIQQRFRLGDLVEANIIDDSDDWIKVRLIRRNQNATWDVQVYGLTGGKGIALNVSKSNIRHPKRDHDTYAPDYVFYEQNRKRQRQLEEASKHRRQIPRKQKAPRHVISTPRTPRAIYKRDPARRRFSKEHLEPEPKGSRLQNIKSTTFRPISKNSRIINSDDYFFIDISAEDSIKARTNGEMNIHVEADRQNLETNYAKAFEPLSNPVEVRSAPLPTPPQKLQSKAGTPLTKPVQLRASSILSDTINSKLKPYETFNTFRRKVDNPELSESLLQIEKKEQPQSKSTLFNSHLRQDSISLKRDDLAPKREREEPSLNTFASYESLDFKQSAPAPMQMKQIPQEPKPDFFPSQHPYGPALKSLHKQVLQIVNNPPTSGLKKVDTSNGIELWKKDVKPAPVYLAMTVFPKNVDVVWATLKDMKKRASLSNHLKEFRVLRAGEISLCYESHKCPWPVTDRDFEYVTQEFVEPRTYAIISTSTREITYRAAKKHIRGHIYFGSWIVKALNDQQTIVYHMSKTNPMGKIPKFALQFSADVMSKAIRNLRNLI